MNQSTRGIYLIRHGMTKGNLEHRYLSYTEESILPSEETLLKAFRVTHRECLLREFDPESTSLVLSPRKRCMETAEVLLPELRDHDVMVRECLSEMDFGAFEYENYESLMSDPEKQAYYQHFIDSGGELPFPEGESKAEFITRVSDGFCDILQELWHSNVKTICFVVHGGTIMGILDRFSCPRRSYFDWMCGCLEGYRMNACMENGLPVLTEITKVTLRK